METLVIVGEVWEVQWFWYCMMKSKRLLVLPTNQTDHNILNLFASIYIRF